MLYTQRIFYPQVADPQRWQRMLGFLERHRTLCHEISFFTEGDGTDWRWLPPDEIAQRASVLGEAVRQARERGFAVAINVLNTMGHSDEGGADAPLPDWRRMIGHDGSESRCTPCPQDQRFLDYVRMKYRAFAGTGAERYWIDDDVRLNHHAPVARGCFCAVCCASLAMRLGREPLPGAALAAVFDQEPAGRVAWDAHLRAVLGAVIDAAVEGVRAVQPQAEIGLMTCEPHDQVDWMARLGRGGHRPWLRPGGGFWNDDEPRALLRKLITVNAQCDGLPTDAGITYEVENYPYAIGAKSAAMTGWECLLAVLSGRLDGVMFDVLDGIGNDPASHDAWLARLEGWAPHLDAVAPLVAGTASIGWMAVSGGLHHSQILQEAGLPLVGERSGARGWLVTGPAAQRLSVAEFTALFALPVLMDGEAAQRCLELGLGERIGLDAVEAHREGIHEVFTDHPLNAGDVGALRGFTLRYFGLTSHALAPRAGTALLSRLVSTSGRALGAACTLHS
nr:hypothetical protein [Planctomycetota bacterium]